MVEPPPPPWVTTAIFFMGIGCIVAAYFAIQGIRDRFFSGEGLEKAPKGELLEVIERLRTKSDRLIIEKQKLKRELDQCRSS